MTAMDDPAPNPAQPEWQMLMAAAARCYEARDYSKATAHYKAAVKLLESLDPRDVDLGRALFQLGLAPRSIRGSSESDESLFKRALAILDESLPPDHPDVIACLRALIDSYFNRWDQKEPLLWRLCAVFERTRGLLDELTSYAVEQLGYALKTLRKYAEAERLYTRWLQAAESSWGAGDRRVIQMVERMAENFASGEDFAKAESLYRRALAARERCYDRRNWRDEDESIVRLLLGLGRICARQGRYEEAEKLLRRCMEKADEKDMGVADALAEVLRKMGREREAFEVSNGASLAFYRSYRGD
jgi:tetratricopeptide (TPR) repeat protein